MTVVLILVLVLVAGLLLRACTAKHDLADAPVRLVVDLHRIRRRFDVALVRAQAEADAADLRHQLDQGLDVLDASPEDVFPKP